MENAHEMWDSVFDCQSLQNQKLKPCTTKLLQMQSIAEAQWELDIKKQITQPSSADDTSNSSAW